MARKYNDANCMGYALKINDWLIPCYWNHSKTNTKRLVETLENDFNLKEVSIEEMTFGKEYIAFRFGRRDFHYMVRGKQGHWRHKPGSCPVVSISQKEVFAKRWVNSIGTVYDSSIFLFEKIEADRLFV